MKRKLVNNETTKNNKIMEQETVNVRGVDRPYIICTGNRIAVTSQLVRVPLRTNQSRVPPEKGRHKPPRQPLPTTSRLELQIQALAGSQ